MLKSCCYIALNLRNMATKNTVIDFIKHDRTLLGGRNLYNKFPGKNLAIQTYLSNLSNNDKNLQIICYELCKLVSVPERQMQALLAVPVSKKKEPAKKISKQIKAKESKENLENYLLEFNPDNNTTKLQVLKDFLNIKSTTPKFPKGLPGIKERKAHAKKLGIIVSGKKAKDYDAAFESCFKKQVIETIEQARQNLIKSKLEELSHTTKESIKLRHQFPFLKEKDCPRVLHLLVADLITAHEEFITKQPLLHENTTQEQMKSLVVDVQASYIEKKEIFKELDYFGKTGSLLKEHALFKKLEEEERIKKMNALDLAKKSSNLTSNINRNKSKFNASKNETDKLKYQTLINRDIELKEFISVELKKKQ